MSLAAAVFWLAVAFLLSLAAARESGNVSAGPITFAFVAAIAGSVQYAVVAGPAIGFAAATALAVLLYPVVGP